MYRIKEEGKRRQEKVNKQEKTVKGRMEERTGEEWNKRKDG